MEPPSRIEIEKYTNEIFLSDIERRAEAYAANEAEALAKAGETHNSGAYVPALIKFAEDRLRTEILRFADALVRAGSEYGVPLESWAEDTLELAAKRMTGGTVSRVRGELNLRAVRLRKTPSHAPVERMLNSTASSAIKEAKLKLKTQRIRAANPGRKVTSAPPPPLEARGTGSWSAGPEPLITGSLSDYPKQFSLDARARMLAARTREALVFNQSPNRFNALFEYALNVALAFAEECCPLVKRNSMEAEEMGRLVTEFRDSIFFHASIDSGSNSLTHPGMWQHITPESKARLDNSQQWEGVQRMIIDVARYVAGQGALERARAATATADVAYGPQLPDATKIQAKAAEPETREIEAPEARRDLWIPERRKLVEEAEAAGLVFAAMLKKAKVNSSNAYKAMKGPKRETEWGRMKDACREYLAGHPFPRK